MNDQLFLKTLTIFFFSLLTTVAGATDWQKGHAPPAWTRYEEAVVNQGFDPTVGTLIQLANDSKGPVRWEAIQILGMRGEYESVPTLRRLLVADPDKAIRRAAATALARLDLQDGYMELRRQLTLADGLERLELTRELALLGDPFGLPFFLTAVEEEDIDAHLLLSTAAALFRVIEEEKQDEIVNFFERVLMDESIRKRQAAINHITIATRHGYKNKKFHQLIMEAANNDPDERVRSLATSYLEGWKLYGILTDLESNLAFYSIHKAGHSHFSTMIHDGLEDRSTKVRLEVIQHALVASKQGLRDEELYELIKQIATEDKDSSVRRAAQNALEEWPSGKDSQD